jgi:hypothetical protein
MFKPQFADLVAAGRKCQTISPMPKRMPLPGDVISLRSKQKVLREATIKSVTPITLAAVNGRLDIRLGYLRLYPNEVWGFAQADGFAREQEMRDWFQAQHGLPFHGVLIQWANKQI